MAWTKPCSCPAVKASLVLHAICWYHEFGTQVLCKYNSNVDLMLVGADAICLRRDGRASRVIWHQPAQQLSSVTSS